MSSLTNFGLSHVILKTGVIEIASTINKYSILIDGSCEFLVKHGVKTNTVKAVI